MGAAGGRGWAAQQEGCWGRVGREAQRPAAHRPERRLAGAACPGPPQGPPPGPERPVCGALWLTSSPPRPSGAWASALRAHAFQRDHGACWLARPLSAAGGGRMKRLESAPSVAGGRWPLPLQPRFGRCAASRLAPFSPFQAATVYSLLLASPTAHPKPAHQPVKCLQVTCSKVD